MNVTTRSNNSNKFFTIYNEFKRSLQKTMHKLKVNLRVIASACGKFCKIEKGTSFTHFGPKENPHQWV